MKRCAARAISRAIKELYRAKKNMSPGWNAVLDIEVSGLGWLLLVSHHSDLLDERTLKLIEARMVEQGTPSKEETLNDTPNAESARPD